MTDAHLDSGDVSARNARAGMSPQIAHTVFWIAAASCAIAEIAILREAFAPHIRARPAEPVPQSRRGVEVMWAVIPALALAALVAATWRAIR